jgi:regulation of enolase protein 1 (concanavalin A-like superfamily)
MTKRFVAAFVAAAWLCCIAANPAGAAFIDDFDTSHDYLTSGVTGTGWDGMLSTSTSKLDSNTTNSGKLTITETATWVGTTAMDTSTGAPFLYLNVTGDFVATTVIDTATVGSWHTVGLVTVDPGNTDSFVTAMGSFTGNLRQMAWSTVDGTRAQNSVSDTLANLNYYQIERSGDTFTSRYSNDSGTNWSDIASVSRADLADTLQVGVFASSVNGSSFTAQFESFEVTQVPEPSTFALTVFALLGLGLVGWRRRRRA